MGLMYVVTPRGRVIALCVNSVIVSVSEGHCEGMLWAALG